MMTVASENMMVCKNCGDAGYKDIGEYPWSWQVELHDCGVLSTPDLERWRSLVVYDDGTSEWIVKS